MSTHIVGFRPADDKWRKMKAVYEACEAAGTAIPPEVIRFFCNEPPGDKPGVEVEVEDHKAVKPYSADMRDGFEVDLTKLPQDIKMLRFYNSY